MNLANQLTMARLVFSIAFVLSLSVSWPYSKTGALLLFLVAGITDYLDGEVARRFNMMSDFGKLMDPLIDKIMIAAGFICLAALDGPSGRPVMPAWVAVAIISREFLITGLRLLALSKGQLLMAESLGKHKTAWQMITIIFFLLLLTLQEWAAATVRWDDYAWIYGGPVLLGIAVSLTLLSGAGYLWKNRSVIEMR